MENLRRRIQKIKKKRPAYGQMLDFYKKVREEQEKVKASLAIEPIRLKKEWKNLLAKEGFSVVEKKDFPIDIDASFSLFQSLCQLGKEANPYMAEQVRKIEGNIGKIRINLKELFKEGVDEEKVEQIAKEFGFDEKVFFFLIHNSIKPSIEAAVEKLLNELNTETWTKGYCPICGSLPLLSLLKEEVGKRFLLCSYCGYQWQTDRVLCPFCNNKDQESLHYFTAEGEENYRIDLCDKCHQYIKTIDLRAIGEIDPSLEDLATLHLDVIASQKGYKRAVRNPWTNH
jgi:FdhE protein